MKSLIICFFFCVLCCESHAQTIIPFWNGADTNKLVEPTIIPNKQGPTITYSINIENAVSHHIYHNQKEYSRLYIKNFGYCVKHGFPELPAYTDLIPISDNNTDLMLVNTVYKEIDNFSLYPSQISINDTICNDFYFNPTIYNQNKFYPDSIITLKEIQEFKGIKYAVLNIYPVQYNPVTKTIRCYSKIEYSLKNCLEPSKTVQTNQVSNRDDYFVICKNNVQHILSDFITWKYRQGYKVHVISKTQWLSSEEVKDSVNSHLANCDTNTRKFMLIVGDHLAVPADVIDYNSEQYVTDYYYACLGNNNYNRSSYLINFAVGRIPYASQADLAIILAKIIDYQQSPQYSGKALVCAKFDSNNNMESRRNIKNSEEIKDYMANFNINTQRVYYANANISPKYYSNWLSFGEEIPLELQRPYFSWNGCASDIVSSINTNTPNIIMYNGHGTRMGWYDIGFDTCHVHQLFNSLYPIVICNSCWNGCYATVNSDLSVTNRPSLAYEFLKKTNGGASAVLAYTNTIMAQFGDVLPAACFDTFFPEPGLIPVVSPYLIYYAFGDYYNDYTVGNAMNGAKTKLMRYFNSSSNYVLSLCERFHCFGDPSSELYTRQPEDLSVVSVKQINDSIIINTNGIQNCKVLLIPKDESQSDLFMMADSISGRYVFPNVSTSYNISIQKHNCALKYYDSYDVYLQNIEFNNGVYRYEGRNIFIGKDVTTEAPQGNVVVKPNTTLTIKGIQSVQTPNNFEVKSGGTFIIE